MVTRIIFIVSLISITSCLYGQELVCGTTPTSKDIEVLRMLKGSKSINSVTASDPVSIAITAHIVRNSDGTGGLTEQELNDAIADVNTIYTLTNMNFFLFGDINYIDNSDYYDFNGSDEGTLTDANNVENTINVYFFNSAETASGVNVCGYAYFPSSGRDHVIMVNSCTTNGSTFPHELGHYFALYHTHGKSNDTLTDELVDGSNCTTAGDELCDTAADPKLTGLVDAGCNYTGTQVDANSDPFVPNPRNLMSYSQKHCRDEFSQGQADRIVDAYQTFKTYLVSKNYAAFFDAADKEVCEGESITYENNSVGATSYVWTFEGGTPSTSTDENPIVTYNAEGVYDVSLTITEAGGEMDTKAFTDLITIRGNVASDIEQKQGGFEEASLEEEIINEDGGITFEQTTLAATEGSSSATINFLSYTDVGKKDYLIVGAFNTSVLKAFELTFDYAYAPYSATYFDGMGVYYRDPCGDWVQVWEKFGTDLQTKEATTSLFIPTVDDWKTETVSFLIPTDVEVIEIAFVGINGYGNNLYIDNYSVVPESLDFEIDNVTVNDATCSDASDGSVTIEVSRLGNFQYSLDQVDYFESNEFLNLMPGSYDLFVRNEVEDEKSMVIEVGYEFEYPEKPTIVLEDQALTVQMESGHTIQWYFNDELLVNETSASLSQPENGVYLVQITNGSCGIMSDPFVILAADKIQDALKLYPSPATDIMNLELPSSLTVDIQKVQIRDLSGRIVFASQLENSIHLRGLNSGMYLLELVGADFVVSRRFLKR